MQISFSLSAPQLRGYRPIDDFTVDLIDDNIPITATGSGITTIKDLTYNTTQNSGYYTNKRVVVNQATDNPPVVLSSLTPSICTITADGTTSRVSNGYCIIQAKGQTGSRTYGFSIATSTGAVPSYTSIQSRAPGSLRKYLQEQMEAALSGVPPGPEAQRAATSPNNYYTNTGTLANTVTAHGGTYGSVNLSNFIRAQGKPGFHQFNLPLLDEILARPGPNSGSLEYRIWISPRHYITWLGHNPVQSTINSYRVVDLGVLGLSEIYLYYSTVEWTGPVVKLPPANLIDYLPDTAYMSYGADSHTPVWGRLYNMYIGGSTDPLAERRWVVPGHLAIKEFQSDNPYKVYQPQALSGIKFCTGGDSGSPVFMGIGGEIVIIQSGVSLGGFSSIYYHLGKHKVEIDATMAQLSTLNGDATIYTSQVIDLTAPITGYPNGFISYA